jgi:hypothetical protein
MKASIKDTMTLALEKLTAAQVLALALWQERGDENFD